MFSGGNHQLTLAKEKEIGIRKEKPHKVFKNLMGFGLRAPCG